MSKDETVPEELAQKILKAELKNIIQKVQSGKTLTTAERKLVTDARPSWEKVGISRRAWYDYKKKGMPEDEEGARKWIEMRAMLQEQGSGKIEVAGRTYTASDIAELRAKLLEGQTENINLKNRLERLNVLEKEGELVPADELIQTLGQILIPLRKALDQMPENIASACNPEDPSRAETIIEQELHNIYADLVKSLKANEKTNGFQL